jgi:hypothetical protein
MKMKKQKTKINGIEESVVNFWRDYYFADYLERRKMVEELPFTTKEDKKLANSFFEDIVWSMQFIKKR